MNIAMYVQCIMMCSATHFEIVFTGPSVVRISVMKNFELSLIVVRWDEVVNVSNYTVTWTDSDGTFLSTETLIQQSSLALSGLTLNTVYNISIVASNSHCTGPEFITSVLFSAGTELHTISDIYCTYVI